MVFRNLSLTPSLRAPHAAPVTSQSPALPETSFQSVTSSDIENTLRSHEAGQDDRIMQMIQAAQRDSDRYLVAGSAKLIRLLENKPNIVQALDSYLARPQTPIVITNAIHAALEANGGRMKYDTGFRQNLDQTILALCQSTDSKKMIAGLEAIKQGYLSDMGKYCNELESTILPQALERGNVVVQGKVAEVQTYLDTGKQTIQTPFHLSQKNWSADPLPATS